MERIVVFFDGVCGLCNGFVDFCMKRRGLNSVLFTPLQGETAKKKLPIEYREGDLSTIVIETQNGFLTKSDAVAHLLKVAGGPWKIAGSLMKLFPRPIRNLGYDMVAKTRYVFFGKKESCRLPTASEKARFLP